MSDIDCRLLIADTVIADFAASEAELRARVRELESDVSTYREIAHEAIHALAKVTKDRDEYKRRYYAALDELRAWRAA